MIRILALSVGLAALLALSGCYHAPVMPPPGYIYADISSVVDTGPMGETLGSRRGSATSTSILGLVAQGDCSVRAAAANGGITNIHHIDYEFKNIVGVLQELTIVVTGE